MKYGNQSYIECVRYALQISSDVTVSIGHTELQVDDTSDLVVKRVDKALYQAKEGGRNIVISC